MGCNRRENDAQKHCPANIHSVQGEYRNESQRENCRCGGEKIANSAQVYSVVEEYSRELEGNERKKNAYASRQPRFYFIGNGVYDFFPHSAYGQREKNHSRPEYRAQSRLPRES